MASYGILCNVALVVIDVSEELNASVIRVTRIVELGTTLALTINRRTLRRNTSLCISDEGGVKFLRNVGTDVRCEEILLRSVRRLLVAACVVPSSPIFVTLMKEAPGSSETSVLTRATRRNNPEDTILQLKIRSENWIYFHLQVKGERYLLCWALISSLLI
jgi:hypothetical protein